MYGKVNRNVIVQAYICMIGPSNEINFGLIMKSVSSHQIGTIEGWFL
jgi:hypothetical protein